jgi:curli production assembly/transport component CsgG|tara:strand:+ start:302 stop:1126 length:825 start_codon:yes stop_codon:yes gene_type:complete
VTSAFLLISGCATHGGYISPCVTNSDRDYKDVVTIIQKAECFSGEAIIEKPITKAIQNMPMPTRTPVVAVYSFNDLTGQRKSVDGVASFSTAVTMAPETYLIRALKQSGFFKVVERKGLDNLTRERQLIRQTRQSFDDEEEQKPLLFAGLIIEGGIVDYNTNLISGGAGARYLGIGTSKQYREDVVVVSLRLVSVSTGEILMEILSSKAILSVGLSNDFFRFITDGTELVEVESGNAMNESKSIAVQAAMETAVVELIREGREKGYWTYWGEKQ